MSSVPACLMSSQQCLHLFVASGHEDDVPPDSAQVAGHVEDCLELEEDGREVVEAQVPGMGQ